MKMISSRRLFVVLGLLMLLSTGLFASSFENVSGEEVTSSSYAALLQTYNQGTGIYGNLSIYDKVVFEETVIASVYHESGGVGRTTVWVSSVGAGEGLPSLNFPIDMTSDMKVDAKVRFTILVELDRTRGNGSQKLTPLFGADNIEILEEGRDNGLIERDNIEIFGITIKTTFLPDEYRTPFVRFLIVFGLWSVASLVFLFIFWIIMKITKRTKTELDEMVLKIVTGPFFLILLLYGLLVSLSQLEMPGRLIEILDMLYRTLTIIFGAYILHKVMKKVIIVYLEMLSKRTNTKADDVLVPVLGKLATVVIWIAAIIMVLQVFGIDITVFLGAMGIVGLVIAFAAQDTLSNFFSGIMILLDRPFKEGDWIELEGSNYQVKHIGLRSTRLFHSISNQLVTIPNNRISDHMFSNLSEPNFLGRKTVNVGVSYDHDPRKIGELLLDIVRTHPDTFEDEEHTAIYRFNSFGDSSLDFSITFWVKDFNDQWKAASEIRESIYDRFARENIKIPFPQRVVHLPGGPVNEDAPTTTRKPI